MASAILSEDSVCVDVVDSGGSVPAELGNYLQRWDGTQWIDTVAALEFRTKRAANLAANDLAEKRRRATFATALVVRLSSGWASLPTIDKQRIQGVIDAAATRILEDFRA